jgi:bifunctional oligoribonuclease and PAP phosphatase NrnA
MNYPNEGQQIIAEIEKANRILAISHGNPDADAVCSILAIKRAFNSAVDTFDISLGPGTIPENLSFLIGDDTVLSLDSVEVSSYDLVMFLDCADERRAGEIGERVLAEALENGPVINIDHHVTNSRFGTINLVDPEAAATCEMLAMLFEDAQLTISPELSTTLMAGIQGDTLGLRTRSTTSRTMNVSAVLLDAGAELDLIRDYLFRIRPYSTLRLWAHALSAVQFTGDLIWTEITSEMLEDSQADESEAEGIVNFLVGTEEARAAAMLYRKPDGWRVSMRSRRDDTDVSRLASMFDGGGHSRAAGCTLIGDESVLRHFLNTIASELRAEAHSLHGS